MEQTNSSPEISLSADAKHDTILLLRILALLLIILSSGSIGYLLGRNSNNYPVRPSIAPVRQLTPTVAPVIRSSVNLFGDYEIKNTCALYGQIKDKDLYLIKYVVKPGDTLLSIASAQLGSSSRIGDIIYLNEQTYPQLSLAQPFIEQGWILYLPPREVPRIETTDPNAVPMLPYAFAGELAGITSDDKWEIQTSEKSAYKEDKYASKLLEVDTNTQFFGKTKNEFKTGDCIKAVVQGYSQRVYSIYIQDYIK